MNIGSLLRGLAADRKLSNFELHIAFTGTGSGSVTQSPPGVVITGDCTEAYTAGSMLSFVATPAENSVFTGWSGDVQGSELACYVIMDLSKNVVANFSLITEQEKRISHFVDNCDGTVTDTRTGLMWMRFAEGQDWSNGHCVGQASRFSLDQAKAISRDFAGYHDWRLPTIDELKSIIEKSRSNPAFDPTAFPGFEKVSPLFWTSSSSNGGQAGSWYVSFYSGSSFSGQPQSRNSVRLVRNTESSAKNILDTNADLTVIASQRIAHADATEWNGSGFEHLLRDIERTDQPSATLMKALDNKPEVVSRAIGRRNRTLLHHAAAHHKLDTVKYLCLTCRADINAMDLDGVTPLDYALAVNAVQVVEYLRANGGRSRKETIESKSNKVLPIQTELSLKIETIGSGEVLVSPKQNSYVHGARVAIKVTPSVGWKFKGWSGYLNSKNPNCLIVMDSDKRIVAHFEEISVPRTASLPNVDNGDGTVLDTETGLTWMLCPLGQSSEDGNCVGVQERLQWHEAVAFKHSFAGYDDWRLPEIDDLRLLVDRDFNKTKGFFWSATRESNAPDMAWVVDFDTGKHLVARTLNRFLIRLVRGGYRLQVSTLGSGFGDVVKAPAKEFYTGQSRVTLTATPQVGSRFTGWVGDLVGSNASCSLIMDADRQITASFEEKLFVLHIKQSGTGSGAVHDNSDQSFGDKIQQTYPEGHSVILTATSASDSVFMGWSGDVNSRETSIALLMNAEKSVSANFQLKSFELSLSQDGSGSGNVTCMPEGNQHPIGTLVTVAANPNPGSVFSGWTGDVTENEPTCRVVMDSAKAVNANFSRLSFTLDVLTAGSGTGSISRNPEAESYYYGDTVTLTAQAARGAIFSGWRGGATGVDATLTITLDTDKTLIAAFKRLNIPELGIAADFLSAEHSSMKSGDDAFIIYLSIANKGQKQFRIELPLVSYVTHDGEEIQQDAWLTGLVIGSEGATVRAGTFRKAGLVFFKSKLRQISAGDQFHVSISQSLPARRFDFSFRCTDSKSRAFTLISAAVEEVRVPLEMAVSTFDSSEILQRLELLEAGLSDVLCRLERLEAAPPELIKNTENIASTVASLSQVLTWLVTRERVSLAALRGQLLPLDQFPGAFVDEINEQALDLLGEIALEEVGDEIIVTREVLTAVIASQE